MLPHKTGTMIEEDSFIDETLEDEVGLYHCTVCNTSFSNYRLFIDHVNNHSADDDQFIPTGKGQEELESMEVDLMNAEASSLGLVLPMKIQPSNGAGGVAQCGYCDRTFVDERALKIHLNKTHNQSNPSRGSRSPSHSVGTPGNGSVSLARSSLNCLDSSVACDECGRRFPTTKQAKVHKFKSHIEPRRKLEKNSLKWHPIHSSVSTKVSLSSSKPMDFFSKDLLSENMNNSTLSKKTSIEDSNPALPGEMEDDSELVACSDCPRTFFTLKALQKHRINVHNDVLDDDSAQDLNDSLKESEDHLQCTGCGLKFTRMNNLTRHMKLYCNGVLRGSAEEESEDKDCEWSTLDEDYDQAYLDMDNTEYNTASSPGGTSRVFTCSLCPKTFRLRAVLRRHLLVHRRGKAFSCNKCGASFTRKYNLKLHCSSRCRFRDGLKKEGDNHGKSCDSVKTPILPTRKPLQCSLCGVGFNHSNNLLTHLKRYCRLRHNLPSNNKEAVLEDSIQSSTNDESSISAGQEGGSSLTTVAKSGERRMVIYAPDSEGSSNYTCPDCHREFSTRKAITSHVVRSHKIRGHQLFFSPQCSPHPTPHTPIPSSTPPVAPTTPVLSVSNDCAHHGMDVACSSCGKKYSSPRALAVHRVRSHNWAPVSHIKRVRCEVCRKRFRNPLTLEMHRQQHYATVEEAPVFKEIEAKETCEEEIDVKPPLILVLRPTPPPPKPALITPRAAVGKYQQLDTSLRTEDGMYECRVCSRLFASRLSLTGHLKSHYKEASKPYSCDTCPRRFTSKNNMRYHRTKFCPNRSSAISKENVDLDVVDGGDHKDKEPEEDDEDVEVIACSQCPRTFASNVALRLHTTRVHPTPPVAVATAPTVTAPLNFPCPRCDRSFHNVYALGAHTRFCMPGKKKRLVPKHKKQTSICPICSRHMTTPTALTNHLKICSKTSKLEHHCPMCQKRFPSRSRLYYHQSWFCQAGTRGMGINFGCSICGTMFSSQTRLEKHKVLSHADFVPVKKRSSLQSDTSTIVTAAEEVTVA